MTSANYLVNNKYYERYNSRVFTIFFSAFFVFRTTALYLLFIHVYNMNVSPKKKSRTWRISENVVRVESPTLLKRAYPPPRKRYFTVPFSITLAQLQCSKILIWWQVFRAAYSVLVGSTQWKLYLIYYSSTEHTSIYDIPLSYLVHYNQILLLNYWFLL